MLSGGGARAAYQVGVLRLLAREFPDMVPGILTGVSAGGINAAYLAARQERFIEKVEGLAELWSGLKIDDVFREDWPTDDEVAAMLDGKQDKELP